MLVSYVELQIVVTFLIGITLWNLLYNVSPANVSWVFKSSK